MAKHTEEELEAMGLTDEELEALEADGDEEELEDDDGEADDDQGADDETTDAEGKADDDEQEQPARAERAPILTAEDPGDTEEKLKAIADSKEKLIEEFDDGELTAKEYQIELDKLAKQERDIERVVDRANLARDMEEQRARNEWLDTVNTFLEDHDEYRKFPMRHRALDAAVRELAAVEENASLSGAEILEKAHDQIVEQFGIQKQPKPKDEGDKKRAGRKIDAPPSLARVPASDLTETGDSTRWSKLDRLMETDPERYEAEMGKLSDADREAYLQAQ